MTEKEMYDCLLSVWENMTSDKDRKAYNEMLSLLDNMVYHLRYDLQCDYTLPSSDVPTSPFTF